MPLKLFDFTFTFWSPVLQNKILSSKYLTILMKLGYLVNLINELVIKQVH